MNLPAFATTLGWDDAEVLPRLRALDLTEPCSRCSGTGYYDRFEGIRCFKCVGHGDQLPKLTLALAREVAVRVVRGGLKPYFRARRAERLTGSQALNKQDVVLTLHRDAEPVGQIELSVLKKRQVR